MAITGVRDVAHFLAAFEELNSCTLSLCMGVTVTNNRPDIRLTMSAATMAVAPVDPVLLASVSCWLSQDGFQTMDAAIMFSLYQLDSAIARAEFDKTNQKA